MTTILWDLDTDDWAAGFNEPLTTVQKTYEDFIQMGSNGTYQNKGQIVLTHEINNTTMTLAVDNLPKIMAAYKNVIDVATCMNITQPYHETTVTRAAFDGSKTASSSVASGAASGAASASDSSASSAASGIAAGAASTSAGIQLSPNALVLAAAAIAAYVF
jgi:hypothetical protein